MLFGSRISVKLLKSKSNESDIAALLNCKPILVVCLSIFLRGFLNFWNMYYINTFRSPVKFHFLISFFSVSVFFFHELLQTCYACINSHINERFLGVRKS